MIDSKDIYTHALNIHEENDGKSERVTSTGTTKSTISMIECFSAETNTHTNLMAKCITMNMTFTIPVRF